jgi:hypothetical protein
MNAVCKLLIVCMRKFFEDRDVREDVVLKKYFKREFDFIICILLCPQAGRAFTFLLDEKSKQKNQEKNTLAGFP